MEGNLGLHREVGYREPPPNDHRIITAPAGELLALLPAMDGPLPPCPDCGGEIVWAEAERVPGSRECAGCGLRLLTHPVRDPDGRTWPWQDGRLTPAGE